MQINEKYIFSFLQLEVKKKQFVMIKLILKSRHNFVVSVLAY